MKGLLVSDIHYRLKQLDWLASVAASFDLVVIAGDHLDVASAVTLEAQVAVTLKYLERVSSATRLVVCSGNHDLNARNAEGEKIAKWMSKVRRLGIAADGESLMLGDTLLTLCPWWDGPSVQEAVARQLAAAAASRTGVAGSGCTTHRRAARRRAGTARATTATITSCDGSANTRPTSYSAATSTSPPSASADRGSIESELRGSSTPAARSVRCPRT